MLKVLEVRFVLPEPFIQRPTEEPVTLGFPFSSILLKGWQTWPGEQIYDFHADYGKIVLLYFEIRHNNKTISVMGKGSWWRKRNHERELTAEQLALTKKLSLWFEANKDTSPSTQ